MSSCRGKGKSGSKSSRRTRLRELPPISTDGSEWSTQIPELIMSDFTQDDHDQVRACLNAIANVEQRMKLSARVELAAMLLAAAAAAGRNSGEEILGPGSRLEVYKWTVDLVVRRALEIDAKNPVR